MVLFFRNIKSSFRQLWLLDRQIWKLKRRSNYQFRIVFIPEMKFTLLKPETLEFRPEIIMDGIWKLNQSEQR